MDNSLNETPHNKYPIIYIVLYISLDFVQYIDYLIYLNGSLPLKDVGMTLELSDYHGLCICVKKYRSN